MCYTPCVETGDADASHNRALGVHLSQRPSVSLALRGAAKHPQALLYDSTFFLLRLAKQTRIVQGERQTQRQCSLLSNLPCLFTQTRVMGSIEFLATRGQGSIGRASDLAFYHVRIGATIKRSASPGVANHPAVSLSTRVMDNKAIIRIWLIGHTMLLLPVCLESHRADRLPGLSRPLLDAEAGQSRLGGEARPHPRSGVKAVPPQRCLDGASRWGKLAEPRRDGQLPPDGVGGTL